ncbi:Six-hairpin glycosidase-like protein [Aspergillus pseudoustus]|uniref:Six-hairpin glycosidase-like protein n=1 Tax=Aspergillus pseudoustus TaxID=1810923 RepID=A0ABR4J8I8_9EURO
MKFNVVLQATLHFAASLAATPYSEYIFAPSSRKIHPVAVYDSFGPNSNPENLCTEARRTTVLGGLSSITYDLGKNVAGIVSIYVNASSSQTAVLGVTFSESSLWISNRSSDATADEGADAPIYFAVGERTGVYIADPEQQRGGFRYVTLVHNSTGTIAVSELYVNFTAAPRQDLRRYTGYFHCEDELLNRIWYAGAYTAQLATIDPACGNSLTVLVTWPPAKPVEYNSWYSNFTITNGTTALTDGGKRDRLVWGGDMTISLETVMVSTGDLASIRNSLEAMLVLQTADGRLPYASHPFPDQPSFTYHLHTLVNFAAYYRYTGDHTWIASKWNQFKAGVDWAIGSIDDTNLAYVAADAASDWLRSGMGGHNIEANALLHDVLRQGALLAKAMRDQSAQNTWIVVAAKLKIAANELLWDENAGLFRDNETSTLYPQDGNSKLISSNLRARWGFFGAPAPEAGPRTISPFIGGFELQAHYLAEQAQTALDLIRLQWGFMLQDHRPTGALTHYTAGIQVAAGGRNWTMSPNPGNLRLVDAGISTRIGEFTVRLKRTDGGAYKSFQFTAPLGTIGTIRLSGVRGTLISSFGERVSLGNGTVSDVKGGQWTLFAK